MDHPQLPGAHRHGAHLPGAGESRRRRRGADLGDLPRHPDRAGGAGGGLFHHPRRRAPALRAADRQAGHRHRLPRRLPHRPVDVLLPQAEPAVRALRRPLRHLPPLRRDVLPGRRPPPRLPGRRLRRGPAGRAAHPGRARPPRPRRRLPGDGRGPRPRAHGPDRVQRPHRAGAVR